MAEPARRRSPATDDPIAHLLKEHDEVLSRLKQLRTAARALVLEGYTPRLRTQFRRALAFLEEEILEHNGNEERALFPFVERYVEGPTRILRREHRDLQRSLARLQKAVAAVERRRDSFSAIHRLATVAADVVHRFVNHIHTENNILFPLVRRVLPKDDLRRVAERLVTHRH